MRTNVLVIDDDSDIRDLLDTHLTQAGFGVRVCPNLAEARRALTDVDFDVVLSDIQLENESGLDLCKWLGENRPNTPVIVITAFGSMETASGALRAGAYDFVTKPFDLELLQLTLERALRHRALEGEVRRLRDASGVSPREIGLLGESAVMVHLARLIDRVSDGDATILICGESGSGKELVARAVHQRSSRKNGPFVAVNCAALPPSLLESELFGHEKGAFTDARQAREGLLRQADGGSLLLDEIGEITPEVQVKLLRALQERRVRPIGGTNEVEFDARILCATNRDLETDVEEGRFREDFYYRINVVTLQCPPLRSRGNDILLLAQHFIRSISARSGKEVRGLSSPAARRLLDYDWPGNVRQLQNVIERAMALAQFDEITVEDLPERIQRYESKDLVVPGDDPEQLISLQALERRYIERVLGAVDHNKTRAARALGLDRRTLYRKLKRYAVASENSDQAARRAG